MTENERNEIRKARRDYQRQWRLKNPDKIRAAQERYWLKQARESEKRSKGDDSHAAP